jgi:hypothetical protein
MTPSKPFGIAGRSASFETPQKAREICNAYPATVKLNIDLSIEKLYQEDQ